MDVVILTGSGCAAAAGVATPVVPKPDEPLLTNGEVPTLRPVVGDVPIAGDGVGDDLRPLVAEQLDHRFGDGFAPGGAGPHTELKLLSSR